MTEQTINAPRLWTPSGFREDGWTHADSAEALESNAAVILPLPVWQALDAETKAANRDRIGVLLAPGEPLDAIVDALSSLPLVALSFPAFNDGRSYSKAELLRCRHGFKGAVRACGQVLVDQISHMIRTGFDELEVSHPVALKRLEEGRAGGLPLYYQPTAKAETPEGKYAWRRKPAA
ncbi:DUF934 domain-containing protein [Aquibium carbonis]|uniref:DUF934 domain-containing protein n=1 Tax=Aquibium carbonis TaxID=2495581 RepID=A0A429Z472_9HYPH|nr:DUF934 domain-containing protein [Aquibium carbonis]RST88484.1 DUF934 domain-containing protein [Aquibium carbonis]